MVLVFGVVEAGLKGWSTFAALGPIIGGVAILAVFVVIETRLASEPLIPFKELTKPLRVANNIVLLFSASLFPMWFVSSLYLQQVLGLSPLHTGLVFLPMTLMIMLVASRTGRLVSSFGVRPVLGGGLVMLTAGMLLLAKIGASRQPDRVHHAPRTAHGGRDRNVDRPLDDRRHPGRQGGAGWPRVRARQHLAPDRGRPGAGGPGDARHAALQPPDRHRRTGAAGAHRRLPPRLPDRRRPRRGGGARHVPGGARPRRRATRSGAPPDGHDRRRRRGLHRDRHGVRGLARRARGRVHNRRRLQLRHRALAASPGDSQGRAHARRQPRARLHPHRQLLQPQLPPDGRPERAADPRRQPAAGVVPPGAGKARRGQPQPADLRRAAGTRVVAGRRHQHWLDRERRRRGRQPPLPDSGAAERRRRLGAYAPRPGDRWGRRVGDGQQERRAQPLRLRRRLQRGVDRLGGAGVQPQDRRPATHAGTRSSTSHQATPTRPYPPTGSRGTPTTSTRSN